MVRCTFGARELFVVGGCPVHCRVFGSIPEIYLLDARSTHIPLVTPRTFPDIDVCFLGNKNAVKGKENVSDLYPYKFQKAEHYIIKNKNMYI